MKTVILVLSAVAVAAIAPATRTLAEMAIPLNASFAQAIDSTSAPAINPTELNRAKNLARQAAEMANGGLNEYRAENSMHGPSIESPFVDNGDGTWTFTFKGGSPGSMTPTVESIVTVDQKTLQVTVDYNGPIQNP